MPRSHDTWVTMAYSIYVRNVSPSQTVKCDDFLVVFTHTVTIAARDQARRGYVAVCSGIFDGPRRCSSGSSCLRTSAGEPALPEFRGETRRSCRCAWWGVDYFAFV